MKLQTPRLKLGDFDFYRHKGEPWVCREDLEEIFEDFEPVAGDIILVGSSRHSIGSVKVFIALNEDGVPVWAMRRSPSEKRGKSRELIRPLRDFAKQFIAARHKTIYLTLYEFEEDGPA